MLAYGYRTQRSGTPVFQHSISVMEILAGKVMNYYRTIGVASIHIIDCLEVGNSVHIKGHTTNFDQRVESLQIRHQQIRRASKGDIVGMKVDDYVRKHDCVYRVEDESERAKKGTTHQVSGTG